MIYGIFYARFLPQEGSRVVHQSPPGCMVPENGEEAEIEWDSIVEYIIPRQAFCNRYITIRDPSGKYVILGYPVNIQDQKYERNEFIFNFGIMVPDKFDTAPYEAVVRRLADTFREMEIQSQYLSMEGQTEGKSIGGLLEIIREDLNNYNECMIPVDDATTINTKLFPLRPDPPAVKAWHVPLAKINFADIVDDKWDLTMRKVIPEIDGVRDVRKIAYHADVSLELTKQSLRHLLYHNTILLLDIFFFSNIYVVMSGIDDFMANKNGMQDDCARYVLLGNTKIPNFWLCKMFTSFQQGRTVKDWLRMHMDLGLDVLRYVDIRRLIQFGVIKGILLRQHKWPVSKKKIAELLKAESRGAVEQKSDSATDITRFVDGCHCFDEITTEMNLADEDIEKALRKLPRRDPEILYR